MRIFKFVFGIFLCFCLIFGLSPTVFANYSDTYSFRSSCPDSGDDPNPEYGFAYCNCTDYVADRINQVFDGMDDDTEFSNTYLIPRWGNAGDWKDRADDAGISTNDNPVPGAVAYWSGHVAFVEAVYYNETTEEVASIDVSEYNFTTFAFSWRNISVGDPGYPTEFIHILQDVLSGSANYDIGPDECDDCGDLPAIYQSDFWGDTWDEYCRIYNPSPKVEAFRNSQGILEYDICTSEGYPYYCTNCEVKYFDYTVILNEFYPGLGGGSGFDSSATSNPYVESTDIHITHCKIRPYKEGSWHEEVDVDMAPGQAFEFEIEGRVRNKSNYDLKDVDIDYCFVKDDKDFDVSSQDRMCLDDDKVDIDEGEKESKHSRRSWVTIASDLSEITVATDDRESFTLPITQGNLDDEEITLYFYLDVETEDEEDRDVSDEAKSDERGKLEIHLVLPQPPPADLNLSVPHDQTNIDDKTMRFDVGQNIVIPVTVYKSGADDLTEDPEVSLSYGSESTSMQNLASTTVDYLELNSDGESTVNVSISPITTPGHYFLSVYVDSGEDFEETDEDDNFNQVYFVVKEKKKLNPAIYLLLNN